MSPWYWISGIAVMDFRFLAALGMTMALWRPYKEMKMGWRRGRATTRVAPTTGLPEAIFIAMTGRGAAYSYNSVLHTPVSPQRERGWPEGNSWVDCMFIYPFSHQNAELFGALILRTWYRITASGQTGGTFATHPPRLRPRIGVRGDVPSPESLLQPCVLHNQQ